VTLRAGHGNGKGTPHIEVKPADEQARPDPTAVPIAPLARRKNGTFDGHAAASEAGRRGGLAKGERTRLLGSLGLVKLEADHSFKPYEDAAECFCQKHVATLASQFDGQCGEGPASIVRTAGIQLAASRFFYDSGKQIGDAKLLGEASRLGDASRQNILASYEIQSREAAARKMARAPGLPSYLIADDEDG